MPLPSSGSLSIAQINTEFALGNNLNAYRGVAWYTSSNFGTFTTTPVDIGQFYSKQKTSNPPTWNTASGSLGSAYTQQSSSFTVSASSSYSGGVTYSVVSGSLAPGQSLNSSNGVISGTASGVADYTSTTFNFTIRATNQFGVTADRAFSYVIQSRYVGYACSTAGEGGTCSGTAPGAFFFNRVDFSSYGTPNGSCGAFTIGSCNSGASNGYNPGVVKSYAVGANNSVWGEPCRRTAKRMYIQMSYGPF